MGDSREFSQTKNISCPVDSRYVSSSVDFINPVDIQVLHSVSHTCLYAFSPHIIDHPFLLSWLPLCQAGELVLRDDASSGGDAVLRKERGFMLYWTAHVREMSPCKEEYGVSAARFDGKKSLTWNVIPPLKLALKGATRLVLIAPQHTSIMTPFIIMSSRP